MTHNNNNALFRSFISWLLLIGATWSSAALSAVDNWSLNSPQGGVVQALAIDPFTANIVYAGTASNGLYKSTDGGATWTHKSSGLTNLNIQVIAIDPLDTHRILVGTNGGGIFRSTNAGNSWTAINDGLLNLNVYSIAFDPLDPNTMYAGTFGNLFVSSGRSATSGVNWIRQGAGRGLTENTIQTVIADPNNEGVFYVGTFSAGVFGSTSGTNSWSQQSLGLYHLNVRYLTHSATGNLYAGTQYSDISAQNIPRGGFHIGTVVNNGVAWQEKSTGLGNTSVNAIVESLANPNVIYVATFNNVYRTADTGENWAAVGTDLSGLHVLALAIDHNTTPETIYAGTPQGVFKITDGGSAWSAVNNGITALNVTGMILDINDPSTQYVTTYGNGVLKSTDSGTNWQYANTGLTDLYVESIAADGSNIYVGTHFIGAFKSTDSGTTWTVSPDLSTGFTTHIADDPASSDLLYAADTSGINITRNGGVEWTNINGEISRQHDTKVQALAIDPVNTSNRRVYLSMKSSGIFYATLGDSDWQTSSVGLTNEFIYAIAIDPTNPNTLYVGTRGNGVFKSIDRGASWFAVNSGLAPNAVNDVIHVNAIAIDPNNSNVVYAGTESFGVYRSLNGGASWSEVSGLAAFKIKTLTVNPETGTLYAGTASSGVFAIDLTTAYPANLKNTSSPPASDNSTSGGGSANTWLLLLLSSVISVRTALHRARRSVLPGI